MSLSNVPVETYRIVDPRVCMNSKRNYYALKSGQTNTWQQFPASNISNNNIVITCTPPSKTTLVSKRILVQTTYQITVLGSNAGGGSILLPGYYAPRAYPYSSVVLNQSLKLANDNLASANFNQYWPTLMWYHNKHDDRYLYDSITPAMLDQFQEYDLGDQSQRNPLAQYKDSNTYETSRGGYQGMTIISQDDSSAVLSLVVTEPIFMSPCNWGCESKYESFLVGINNITYSASLGNLERLMSFNAAPAGSGVTITSVTGSLISASIFFEYITPDPFIPIPRMTVYPYFDCVLYTQDTGVISPALATGVSRLLKLPNIQLSSIPRRIYVWAGKSQQDKHFNDSDSYMAITQPGALTVTYDTSQLFQQASQQDLYLMSVENGLQMSFDQWSGQVGSVLCIDLGKDLQLPHDKCPGMLDNVNFSLQCNFTNVNPNALAAITLYCVVVYEGVMTISDGSVSHYIAPVSRNDLLNSEVLDRHQYKQAELVYGGNVFTNIRDFFAKAIPAVGKYVPFVKKAYDLGEDVYKLASGSRAKKGKKKGKKGGRRHKKGGVLVESGGRMISRAALAKRMRGGALDDTKEQSNDDDESCSESESESDEENKQDMQ